MKRKYRKKRKREMLRAEEGGQWRKGKSAVDIALCPHSQLGKVIRDGSKKGW